MQQVFSKRTLYILSLLVFVLAIIFSVFYYTAGSNQLINWFFGLNDCFYRVERWRYDFFTPPGKEAGNRLCALAIFISLAGIVYILRKWRTSDTDKLSFSLSRNSFVWFLAVTGLAIGLWIYSNSLIAPAYDEIFSAVNCASLHPFQTLSYYMLPNNHIFFNLVNNIVFHPFDKVGSGRIISLFAYIGTLLVVFCWFRELMVYRVFAFIGTFLVAIQFTTLGFSSQARGYELQLLAGWAALASLYKYYRTGTNYWMRWHSFACIIGYITVPTFLFVHVAILLFAFLKQAYERNIDLRIWKYQLICFCFVFLFYLPALSFSGIAAFADNQYVNASFHTWEEYLPKFVSTFKYFVNYGFSFMLGENNRINYFLFLLPMGLIFSRRKSIRSFAVFYLLLWLVFVVLALYMKRVPFCRNLILHYSITQALVVFTIFTIVTAISKGKFSFLRWILFPAVALLLSIHYLTRYSENYEFLLYFNHVNEIYAINDAGIKSIPEGSSIGFSNESFYWYYHCSKRNYKVNKCPAGDETYFIKRPTEDLPDGFESKYRLLRSLPEDYEVYIRQ